MRRLLTLLFWTSLCFGIFITQQAMASDALEEVAALLDEAGQLRAAEFAPETYGDARRAYDDAKQQIASGKSARAVKTTNEARALAQQAILVAQKVSSDFAELVEARDRLQMTGADKVRKDLAKRAEETFDSVIAAMESDNMAKARTDAKLATKALYAAEFVASREQIIDPLSQQIAEARRAYARKYAPVSFDKALAAQNEANKMITENPRARTQARNTAKRGEDHAGRALRIAQMGKKLSSDDSQAEAWVDEQDAMLNTIASGLGIQLNPFTTPEERITSLQQAWEDMKAGYQAQIQDAEGQIRQMAQKLEQTDQQLKITENKLAKYEGDIARYEGELAGREADLEAMADMRRKLQATRDAEAKIKRIAGLFNKETVEILLTTDADVILRMKGLNFRSGSSVIPPEGYSLLDNVLQTIAIFPQRNVRIEGHTDSIGSNLYNQALSERRAKSVEEYLLSRMEGATANMEAVGHGEERPIANNETEDGRKRNRRIDIVLPVPGA